MKRAVDLSGRKIGRWQVVTRVANSSNGSTQWLCLCACGTERIVKGKRLLNGSTVSCGCYHAEVTSMIRTHDLAAGDTFGKWVIVSADCIKSGKMHWTCRCECGTIRSVNGSNLRSGKSRGCGKCGSLKNSV